MNSERQLHISSRCVFGVWWPLWKPRLASKQRRSNLTSTSNDQVETRIPDLRCAAKLSTVLVPSLKGDSTPLYSPLSLPLSLSLSLFALLCLGLGAGAVLPLSLPLSLSLSLSLSPRAMTSSGPEASQGTMTSCREWLRIGQWLASHVMTHVTKPHDS